MASIPEFLLYQWNHGTVILSTPVHRGTRREWSVSWSCQYNHRYSISYVPLIFMGLVTENDITSCENNVSFFFTGVWLKRAIHPWVLPAWHVQRWRYPSLLLFLDKGMVGLSEVLLGERTERDTSLCGVRLRWIQWSISWPWEPGVLSDCVQRLHRLR